MRYEQTAISNLDSYKIGHVAQYPKEITRVMSNFTPRNDTYLNIPAKWKDGKIVWGGVKIFLEELKYVWDKTFFDLPWEDVKADIESTYLTFVGPNGVTVDHFKQLHDLGYLPLRIKSLPEGMLTNIGVPCLTITNTEDFAFWLPNALETWLSTDMWKFPTSATIARAYRKCLNYYSDLTGSSVEFRDWQIHDFSLRGMGGIFNGAQSGAGHLLFSLGTDNVPAYKLVKDVYQGGNTFIGGSVPATEHSVMCAGGKDSELETFSRLMDIYPTGVVSIVSDTWNFWDVVGGEESIAFKLKDKILARKPDGLGLAKVVFRPDSGDPVKIVCGDPDATDPRVRAGAIECLWDIFGGTFNEKGFKTLNQRVGLIYGDSITVEREEDILEGLMEKGFAADNIVFGVGSYTYQYNTRDTLGFAMKATYVEKNGVGEAIFKDPATDSGTKKSAKGLLRVDYDVTGVNTVLYDNQTVEQERLGLLETVFLNGVILSTENLATMRARANQ